MRVEIWSDVVCPWCYIGKRRFDTAVERVMADPSVELDLEVVYRPYQLDPTAPQGSTQPVAEAYAKKFGGAERAEQILHHVTNVAAESGIEFRMDRALRANTLTAHRVIWFAGVAAGPTVQAAVKERLLEAYFTDGADVGDPQVVTDCAVDAGLDRDAVAALLAGDGGTGEVMEEIAQAAAHGITAVPTYVIDGEWAIPGAQDVEVFERVLRKLAARQSDG
jgi:predicted DsbA family dithiol-disulfide isomerase